ncbi:murein biosynthesis integral membrane protein MurJ [Romboutsia hominis]|uniref:Probable lipid II flippase MurJ n=1 Tax=Romboutsia hominis TaxID=1507512 RepID=A0A2P2BSR0_9FIRM|nr:murein biosynthesis integral membrane protein MurJ [Romboutsia hominis]CEI73362.1 Protein MurJ homolog [Romboutsia hominis]
MSRVLKATIGLMLVTLLAKVLGFGRELVLASIYGTSSYSDAYLTAMNIPNVIFSAIGATLSTTFIPLYFETNKVGGKEKSLEFANNILNIVVITSIILAIVSLVFTKPLVKLFAIGFEGEILKTTIEFTRILVLGIIFIGLTDIMVAYLQIHNNFTIPGLISVPYNIIIIASIIMSIWIGPKFMVWGTLIAIITKFIFLIPFAKKYSYKYKLRVDFKDPYLKKMFILVLPVFIGVMVTQANAMIDRTLASTLVEGSISALNYANRLNEFVLVLFIASVGSVMYPILSKLSSENNQEEIKKIIERCINCIIILAIPISVGAIVLSEPIVKVLFQRGAFDETATNMTSIALIMYSIGLVGLGLRDILRRIFYSLKDTKSPMVNGIISMLINIGLNLLLVKKMGHAGLALATSISSIICVFLFLKKLKQKIGYFGQDKIMKVACKTTISSIIMGIITYITYNNILSILKFNFGDEIISLGLSISVGAIAYAVLIKLFNIEEFNILIKMLMKKINKA